YRVVLSNSVGSVTSDPAVVNVTLAPTYVSYQAAVLADNPIHYYRMDESSGTTAADLGSQNIGGGIYTGGYQLGQPPISSQIGGTSVRFDGAPGTFVDCGLIYPGPSVTVEAWV